MAEPEVETALSPTNENLDNQESPIDRLPSPDVVVTDASAAGAPAADNVAPVADASPDTVTGAPTNVPVSTQVSKLSPPNVKAKQIVPPIAGIPANGGGDDTAPLSARSAEGRMGELASFAEELPIANRNKEDIEKRQEYFNRLRGKNMKLSLARLENIKAQEMLDLPSLVLRKSFLFAKTATPKKDSPPKFSSREPRSTVPGEEDLSFVEFRFMLLFIQEFIRVQVVLDVTDVTQILELASVKQKLRDRNYADAVAFMDSHKEISEALSFERIAQYAVKRRLDARVEKIAAQAALGSMKKSGSMKGPALVQADAQRLGAVDTAKPPSRTPVGTFTRTTPKLPPTTKVSPAKTAPTSKSFVPGSRLGPSRLGSKAESAKTTSGVTPKITAKATRPPTSTAAAKVKAAPPKVALASKTAAKAKVSGTAAPGVPMSKMKAVGTAFAPKVKAPSKGAAKAPSATAKSNSGPFSPPARTSEQVLWDKLAKLPKQRESQEKLFAQFDPNVNGVLGLNEIQQGLTQVFLFELDTQVTTRAYQAAKDRGPGTEDAVSVTEFPVLLTYLRDYAELRVMFPRTDVNEGNVMNSEEFTRAQEKLASWGTKVDDPAQAFAAIDSDGKGSILFNDFCDWAIKLKFDLPKDNTGARISQTSGEALKKISRKGSVEEGSKRLSQGSAAKLSQDSAAKLSQGSAAKLSLRSGGIAVAIEQKLRLDDDENEVNEDKCSAEILKKSSQMSEGIAKKTSQLSVGSLKKNSQVSGGSVKENSQVSNVTGGGSKKNSQVSGKSNNSSEKSPILPEALEELSAKLPTEANDEDEARRKEVFDQMDARGNGFLSLAEIDSGLPTALDFDLGGGNQNITARAYQAAKALHIGSNGDYITYPEFSPLLHYIRTYTELNARLSTLGASNDGRIGYDEFVDASEVLAEWGLNVDGDVVRQAFQGIVSDSSETVHSSEFCHWAATQKLSLRFPVPNKETKYSEPAWSADAVSPTNKSARWCIDEPGTQDGSARDVNEGASARTSGMTGDQSGRSGDTGGSSKRRKKKKRRKKSSEDFDVSSP
eukprot:GEMP01002699.1.p1 GENE.GEMP01002699.1~~GEMP01002699.1.p1  ORF type:complete len:1055 (+),score=280.32 GEMP01002699.1:190-3354(+)